MKQRIVRLTVLQTGKVLAALYTIAALIFLPFILIGILINFKMFVPMLLMFILYPVMGFIGGILLAFIYNLAAKWVGGLEVVVSSGELE